jgi:hypothetical protein
VQCLCLGVARRRRAVEEVEVACGMVLNPLAQHVDDPTFADLSRKTLEEFEAVDVLGVVHIRYRQRLDCLGLGIAQEGEELRHIERVGAVVTVQPFHTNKHRPKKTNRKDCLDHQTSAMCQVFCSRQVMNRLERRHPRGDAVIWLVGDGCNGLSDSAT